MLLLGTLVLSIGPAASWASSTQPPPSEPAASADQPEDHTKPWYKRIEWEWGGHLKVRGGVSWVQEESLFQPVGTGAYYDGHTEGRLKGRLFFGKWGYLEAHYEAILSGGDTHRKSKELERLYPALFSDGLGLGRPVDDDRRLVNLTHTLHEDDHYILYHRLDRLSLTLLPQWGLVRIGRQAVTWGNGLLFNPMDLCNPFSPTDIERDYKIGDDMVFAQVPLNTFGDVQILYAPRRDPVDGHPKWSHSSLAGKLHFAVGTTEFDLMVAKHYEDAVIGLGSTGYLGDAAWRLDATGTFLPRSRERTAYLSLTANMDYSWVWWGKNFYGLIEFFFNGLSHNEYEDSYTDPDISERLARGELHTLGRTYLSGYTRVELHPLVNVSLTVINNLADPSGIVQPRVVWDALTNVQITLGGNIYYGTKDTEYGRFELPGTDLDIKPADNVFLWMTYYF